jgi:aminoglycoside phosphotransferase family enzyme
MSDQSGSPRPSTDAGRECSLAEKVAYLRGLLGPGDEAIETHFAWVFLTGHRAWKLRKPVRRDTMDYGTIEARRLDSEEDVRLNRRLAPHAYLGTQALTRDGQGRLAIGGDGEVVDWLVKMRRLDRSRMLDAMLARGAALADDLRRVAALLARFYTTEPAAVTDGGVLQSRLQTQVEANHRVLATLDAASARAVRDAQLAFLDARRELLDARAAEGCVIEAHGDLRPEHVLLDNSPAVIDCLEFDRNLRVMDRAEELAFLELECDRLGAPEAGRLIARECLNLLADQVPDALACFYRGHRAATRAKLCVWRASEPDGGPPPHWQATAHSYVATAQDASRAALRLSAG